LAEELNENALPENRHYVYHHFHENCATKPRDLIDQAVNGALRGNTSGPSSATFRDHGHQGLADSTPLLLALDLFLARGSDTTPSVWESAFLPEVLRGLVKANLGIVPVPLYLRQGPVQSRETRAVGWWFLVLGLILAGPLALAALAAWRKRWERVGGFLSVFVPAFLGMLIWSALFLVTIDEVRFNELVFVLVPFDFAMPFLRRRRGYAQARLFVIGCVWALALVGVFKQPVFWPAWLVVPTLLLAAFSPDQKMLAEVVGQGLERTDVVEGQTDVDGGEGEHAVDGDPNSTQTPE